MGDQTKTRQDEEEGVGKNAEKVEDNEEPKKENKEMWTIMWRESDSWHSFGCRHLISSFVLKIALLSQKVVQYENEIFTCTCEALHSSVRKLHKPGRASRNAAV